LVSGRRIGVELGEWLNEEEIQAAKQKERLEEASLNDIGDQGPNPTQHIRYVWLHLSPHCEDMIRATTHLNAMFTQLANQSAKSQCVVHLDRQMPLGPLTLR